MANILTSVPPKPVKFPPAEASRPHRVNSGDNWWSLAAKYGRSDPWDIIEFNFRTRNPREVNWYMESFIGCRFAASDGYNFRFDGSDDPGLVYIPPPSWTPSEDLQLRRMVAFALSGSVLARLNVHYAGQAVTGSSLAAVANRVIDGTIDVLVDSALTPSEAEYDPVTDILHLGFRHGNSRTQKGLIVHEAVHAALDMRSAAGMTVAQSESLAYVVQCYYVREYTLDPDAERLTDPIPLKDRVYELAWDMAAKLSEGKQPESIEWGALDYAVRQHPTYKRTAGNKAVFDGI